MFLICLKIFLARIIDVCLGTFRTVCIVKGKSINATLIAFVEVSIWFLVAREALNSEITSIFIPLSYAGGFATGTYLGLLLSEQIVGGILNINVISAKIRAEDIDIIKNHGYGVSVLNTQDNKTMLIIQIEKKHFKEIKALINQIDKNAFLFINETKFVHNGVLK